MDSIFHEKQDGALCAQHCLNNLLQGEYFTPVDLSSIAQQLDEEERMRMAEGGMASDEYRIFLRQPSGNMDDSGFFSIQVISSALGKVWGLEQVLFNSPEYRRQMIEPTNEKAFICNYKEHWFTVRRLGQQWFNLNSLLTGPELISDTYLALFLAQLQQEGYSIFVILGNLPECEADQVLGMVRVQQQQRPRLIGEVSRSSGLQGRPLAQPSWTAGMGLEDGDSDELRRALALSRRDVEVEDEDADLRQAIQLSMQGGGSGGGGAATSKRSLESNVGNVKTSSRDAAAAAGDGGGISEGTQSELARSEPPAEELRRRRQAYFDRRPNQQQAEDGSTGSSGSGSQGRASDGEESPARNKP